jgi:hypothetical protein
VIAFLSDPHVVRRVLEHLGMPNTAPPIWPARTESADSAASWPCHEEGADELWTDETSPRPQPVAGRAPP